jgi:hypothetical protein
MSLPAFQAARTQTLKFRIPLKFRYFGPIMLASGLFLSRFLYETNGSYASYEVKTCLYWFRSAGKRFIE